MRRRPVLVLALLCCSACPKKDPPPAEPQKPAAEPKLALPESKPNTAAVAPRPDAEVEFVGTWSSKVKASKFIIVAQAEPCVPVPTSPKRFGNELALDQPGALFAEFFMPQGTLATVCVYALDEKGAVVGAGTFPETPKTFEGLGELIVGPHAVEVAPLPPAGK